MTINKWNVEWAHSWFHNVYEPNTPAMLRFVIVSPLLTKIRPRKIESELLNQKHCVASKLGCTQCQKAISLLPHCVPLPVFSRSLGNCQWKLKNYADYHYLLTRWMTAVEGDALRKGERQSGLGFSLFPLSPLFNSPSQCSSQVSSFTFSLFPPLPMLFHNSRKCM